MAKKVKKEKKKELTIEVKQGSFNDILKASGKPDSKKEDSKKK